MSGCGHVYNYSSPEPILLVLQGVCVPIPGLGTEHGHASHPHSEADLYWLCTAELCQATGRQRWTARSRRDSVILLHTFTPPPPLLPSFPCTLSQARGVSWSPLLSLISSLTWTIACFALSTILMTVATRRWCTAQGSCSVALATPRWRG